MKIPWFQSPPSSINVMIPSHPHETPKNRRLPARRAEAHQRAGNSRDVLRAREAPVSFLGLRSQQLVGFLVCNAGNVLYTVHQYCIYPLVN